MMKPLPFARARHVKAFNGTVHTTSSGFEGTPIMIIPEEGLYVTCHKLDWWSRIKALLFGVMWTEYDKRVKFVSVSFNKKLKRSKHARII